MNKILNINLGGYALTIDDDAYEYLSAYFDSLKRRFSDSEGREEIIRDIEARMGELITQDLGGRSIVMLPDVEAAVGVMGKPEDFGGEPIGSTGSTGSTGRPTGGARPQAAYQPGRRLFRDEEDKVVGGVCAGLAAYFGMQDPVWMRLIFVVLTFASAGFWIPAYLLFWIIVPPAASAADRLAMRGQPINVDNIAREIEDGFDRFGNRVSELGRDVKKKGGTAGRSAGGIVRSLVMVIGQLFGLVVRFFLKFGVLIAILVGIALFIGLLASWIGAIWGLAVALPYLDYVSPFDRGGTWFGILTVFLLFGIPVVAIILLFVRAVFRKRTPGAVKAGLGIVWALSLFSAITLGTYGATGFREEGEITKAPDLSSLRSDTLRLEWAGQPNKVVYRGGGMRIDGLRLDRNGLTVGSQVRIRVRKATAPFFEVTQTVNARGRTSDEAVENAALIGYNVGVSGNKLLVPTEYSLPKGAKWRNQEVDLVIDVPVGKYVVFGPTVNDRVHSADYSDPNGRYYIYNNPDRVFRMTEQGLVCTDCPVLGDADYEEDNHYENFILEGDFQTEILKGDDFSIQFEGTAAGQDARNIIRTVRTGDKFSLTTNGQKTNGSIRVRIKTPVFTSLFADGGEISIRGFDEGRAAIDLKNAARLRAFLDCNQLDVNLSGPCQLELSGEGQRLDATLRNGAMLEAGSYRTSEAEISANEASKARLHVKNYAVVRASRDSDVRIDGGAEVSRPNEGAAGQERMD